MGPGFENHGFWSFFDPKNGTFFGKNTKTAKKKEENVGNRQPKAITTTPPASNPANNNHPFSLNPANNNHPFSPTLWGPWGPHGAHFPGPRTHFPPPRAMPAWRLGICTQIEAAWPMHTMGQLGWICPLQCPQPQLPRCFPLYGAFLLHSTVPLRLLLNKRHVALVEKRA